jgi:hypothetical protein
MPHFNLVHRMHLHFQTFAFACVESAGVTRWMTSGVWLAVAATGISIVGGMFGYSWLDKLVDPVIGGYCLLGGVLWMRTPPLTFSRSKLPGVWITGIGVLVAVTSKYDHQWLDSVALFAAIAALFWIARPMSVPPEEHESRTL